MTGMRKKTLRVSRSRAGQRPTIWLQMPYKYNIPLLTSEALLHWLIARSLSGLCAVKRFQRALLQQPRAQSSLRLAIMTTSDTESRAAHTPQEQLLRPWRYGVYSWLFSKVYSARRPHPGILHAGLCSRSINAASHRQRLMPKLRSWRYGVGYL